MGRGLRVSLAALACSLTCTSAAAAAQPLPAGLQVVIEGRGWGHGVGMSQDGAFAMGAGGASTDEILEAFYPGTTFGHRSGAVHVTLFDAPRPAVTVSLPSGGEVLSGSGDSLGFPIAVAPGGSVRVANGGGRLQVTPLDGATPTLPPETPPEPAAAPSVEEPPAAPAPPTTLLLGILPLTPPPPPPAEPPAAPAAPPPPESQVPAEPATGGSIDIVPEGGSSVVLPELGRRYRGPVEAVGEADGLQLINQVDVEQYLRGMGEVRDPGWPPAALRAQAIAARTYAMRAPAAGRTLCSTDQCQVYLGETVEYGAMNEAVADTEGQVLLYNGSLALTVYSASGGGISASTEEGFGSDGSALPYLRVAEYPSRDPLPWSVRVGAHELAGQFGHGGEVTAVRVSKTGPSGRALEVIFEGPERSTAVEGRAFAARMALRSTLFTIKLEGTPGPDANLVGPVSVLGVGDASRAPLVFLAGTPDGLGRPPWVALALLLVVAWASIAVRSRPSSGR